MTLILTPAPPLPHCAPPPLLFPQIRWLHPVDVTGLPLNRIVTIGEGEVYCYADEDKPPVGQGLNVDAEVTL